MAARKNIICKQRVYFSYSGGDEAFAVQRQANELCTVSLHAVTDKLLEKYYAIDETISLDKLEINIDVEENGEWTGLVAEEFEKKLKQQLEEKIQNSKTGAAIKKWQVVFFETLSYFLKHGVLPWNSPVLNKQEFETMLSQWIAGITEDNRTALAEILRHTNAVARLDRKSVV